MTHLTANQPIITPKSVVTVNDLTEVTCYWCKKMLAACNGERTLEEVAQEIYMPLAVCVKLVRRSLEQGWAYFATSNVSSSEREVMQELLWMEVESRLRHVIGKESGQMMLTAAASTGQEEGSLEVEQLSSFLLALEVMVGEECRYALNEHMSALRTRYFIDSSASNWSAA